MYMYVCVQCKHTVYTLHTVCMSSSIENTVHVHCTCRPTCVQTSIHRQCTCTVYDIKVF